MDQATSQDMELNNNIVETYLGGRYHIERVLGRGGFGVTYLAHDEVLDCNVAIKEYLPSEFVTRAAGNEDIIVFTGERQEQFEYGKTNFINEARRLAKCQDLNYVVKVFDCFEAHGTAYIVMEYLEGQTLSEHIRDHKYTVPEALEILNQILDGLMQIHSVGIIHRDISPDNIFIKRNGDVRLIDFGASRFVSPNYSKSMSVMLKDGFAPEEQYMSHGKQGTWTDVYGAAATFYTMITGENPVSAVERKQNDTLKKPSKCGVKIKKSVQTALLNALNVRAEERTQTAEEFKEQLVLKKVRRKRERRRYIDIGKITVRTKVLLGITYVLVGIFAVAAGIGFFTQSVKLIEKNNKIATVRVPALYNLSLEEAKEVSERLNINLNVVEEKWSKDLAGNRILNQSMEEGIETEEGSTIDVSLSIETQTFQMPKLIGHTEEEVKNQLSDLYMTYETYEVETREFEDGTIIEQSIGENEYASYGNSVQLGIAKKLPAYFEEAGLDARIVGLNQTVPLTVPCHINPSASTTGRLTFTSYNESEVSNGEQAKEGYVWKTVSARVVFSDNNAYYYGICYAGSFFEDYYQEDNAVFGADNNRGTLTVYTPDGDKEVYLYVSTSNSGWQGHTITIYVTARCMIPVNCDAVVWSFHDVDKLDHNNGGLVEFNDRASYFRIG